MTGARRSAMVKDLPTVPDSGSNATDDHMVTVLEARGDDPAARRDADRDAVTVRELAERFDREHISVRVKASTAKGYRRLLERTIRKLASS